LFGGTAIGKRDGWPGRGNKVEPPIPEADDDLTLLELRAEAHEFAAAATNRTAAAPVPEQLRRSGSRPEAHRRHDGPRRDARVAQEACDDHRSKLPLALFSFAKDAPPPSGPC